MIHNKDYYLFIDETGVPNPLTTQSNLYILCGCSILHSKREELEIKADQIKFKYWGKTDIVFHSIDIAKEQKAFSIFRNNEELKKDFYKDLFRLLHNSSFMVTVIVVDKKKAIAKGWTQKEKILKETAHHLLQHYIIMLYAKDSANGKIIIESSAEKDPYYLAAFNSFLSSGIPQLGISTIEMKKLLTAITFATKDNNDIETQLCDLVTYGANCKYLSESGLLMIKPNSYEEKILEVLKRKLLVIPTSTRNSKKRLLKKINPFLILPT